MLIEYYLLDINYSPLLFAKMWQKSMSNRQWKTKTFIWIGTETWDKICMV